MDQKLPDIYDAGGDIKKQWFVYYSYKDPDTKKFERIKIFKNINSFKTKSERYEYANFYKEAYKRALESGWSPFKVYGNYDNNNQNIITCIDSFVQFISNSKLRKNTRKKYEYELGVFKRWLEESKITHLRIGEIKKQHCIKIVAKYFGRFYSLQFLRDLCGITKEGVSMLDISYACEKISLRTISVRLSFDELIGIIILIIIY